MLSRAITICATEQHDMVLLTYICKEETMDQNKTPVEPQAPAPEPTATPEPVIPAPQGQAPYPHSSNKTGLIVGIIAGVLVIGGVVALILMLTMGGISKKDYENYAKSVDTVRDEYKAASSDVTPYLSAILSGGTSRTTTEEVKELMSKYKTASEDLSKEKALKDEDIKKAYDAFTKKNDQFMKFVDSIVATKEQFSEANDKCGADRASGISTATPDALVSTYDAALGPCVTALDELAKVENKEIAEYAKKMAAVYREQRTLMVQLADAGKSGDAAAVSAARSKVSTQASKFNTVAREFSTSFRETTKNNEVKDELNALIKLANEKVTKK